MCFYVILTTFAENTEKMFDTILNHRSIRKYTGEPVPTVVLDYILEAGTRASTTGNMQLYSVIVSTEDSIKEELSPCHFNQPMVKEEIGRASCRERV